MEQRSLKVGGGAKLVDSRAGVGMGRSVTPANTQAKSLPSAQDRVRWHGAADDQSAAPKTKSKRRIELPAGGFSVLPAVFSVPEHRPTADIRHYHISTSAAALGGRCVGGGR